MTVKVEVGFTEAGNSAPFLTLDDPVKGVLDNTEFVLGGAEVLVDISEFFESFSIQRGRSRELEKYNAGQITVNFYNNTRAFDPTFETSPYFGQIVPKRQIKVSVDSEVQFEGTIDDWNIAYDAGGQSIATAQAFDGFSFFSNIFLPATSTAEESTSDRITRVLDTIDWPVAKRDIDPGGAILSNDPIEVDTATLDYLQLVNRSEPGDLFISKNGSVKFVGRNVSFQTGGLVLSDDGSNIGYQAIQVVYGSELLYNSVEVTSTAGTASSQNTASIGLYGERDLIRETLLSDQDQLDKLSNYLINRYAEPEFRFERISIDLKTVTTLEREDLIGAELGDVVNIKFTPSGISPQIDRFAKIIGIEHIQNPSEEKLAFNFQSVTGALFVLNDPTFGTLDEGNALGW